MNILIDYFKYSQGNVKALIICIGISFFFFIIFLLSFLIKPSKRTYSKVKNTDHPVSATEGVCSKCGRRVNPGDDFCKNCGNRIR